MNLKTASATIALGVAGLLVMAIGAWVMLVGPIVGEIGAAGEARTQAQDANDNLQLQLTSLGRQAADLPQTNRVADRVEEIWPPTADQPGFFEQVAEAADVAGIRPANVTALSPGVPVIVERDASGMPVKPNAAVDPAADPAAAPVSDTRRVAVQAVTISVTGTYDELSNLLENLEEMPRAMLIGSVELTASDEDGLTMTIGGSTFVAPPLDRAKAPKS